MRLTHSTNIPPGDQIRICNCISPILPPLLEGSYDHFNPNTKTTAVLKKPIIAQNCDSRYSADPLRAVSNLKLVSYPEAILKFCPLSSLGYSALHGNSHHLWIAPLSRMHCQVRKWV